VRVLIACEVSGIVRDAFRAHGHDAWSCDLQANASEFHIVADARSLLADHWDLLIAHPPCRYLCASGMHWTTRGLRDPRLTVEAIAFAEALWAAPIARIAIENPVGCLSTRSKLGKPAQTIQPHQFGDDASKQTCLWLRGLPLLGPTLHIAPRIVAGKPRWANQTDSGQNRLGPSPDRAQRRAQTYRGIAEAMVAQWG
jgi:hypothetical protein